MSSTLAAVVFDFDGLLMDTESTLFASWQFEWQQWGLTLDGATFFAAHGGDVTAERYDTLAQAVGRGYDRGVSRARRRAYCDQLHADLGLADGISEWILSAQAAGVRLAVASSSPTDWVERHLRQVNVIDAFDVIACGDEVDEHKPAPDVYRLALERLGAAVEQCVAVEDTPHGVDAAHAAGLVCVAIPNPFVAPAAVGHAEVVLASARGTSLVAAMASALHHRR